MDFSAISGGGPGMAALGLILAGVVAGLAAGTLGVGGGIVLVPALYLVLGDFGVAEGSRLALAAGTGFAAMIPAALAVADVHRKAGTLDLAGAKRRALAVGLGAAFGTAALCVTPRIVPVSAFAAAALFSAVLLFAVKDGRAWLKRPPGRWADALLGLVGGFTGIGESAVAAPGWALAAVDPRKAEGTAAALDALIGTVGALVAVGLGWGARGLPDYSYGYVNLAAFAVAAPAMFLAATFAAPLSATLRASRLRKVFALFVLVSAGNLIWTALG
jgi:uncharacterized membrane protein YfcA